MKKAQGLSMQTLIIAALVLIVLVVSVVIFVRNSDQFVDNIEDCASKFPGASCQKADDCSALRFGQLGCSGEKPVCCKPIKNEEPPK